MIWQKTTSYELEHIKREMEKEKFPDCIQAFLKLYPVKKVFMIPQSIILFVGTWERKKDFVLIVYYGLPGLQAVFWC